MKKYVAVLCKTRVHRLELEIEAEDIGAARAHAEAVAADPAGPLSWELVEEGVRVESVERAKEPR